LRSSSTTPAAKQPGSNDNNKNNIEPSSSRIGSEYQVSFLPPSNTYDKLKHHQRASSSSSSSLSPLTMCKGDVIWDPVQAQKAAAAATGADNIHDMEAFINQGNSLDARMLLMESLHKTGYNINNNNKKNSPAMHEFFQLAKRNTNVNVRVSMEEREKFAVLFAQEKKVGLRYKMVDRIRWFAHISQSTGYSMQQVLVQYYGWKGDLKQHDVAQYKMINCLAKKQSQQQASDDYCCICDDGGILIICDGCAKSHHVRRPRTNIYTTHISTGN
jgi:hypothetical protein